MKKILLNCLLVAFALTSTAQQKLLSMEEAIIKSRTSLAPKGLKQLSWISGTDKFYYIKSEKNDETLVVRSVQSKDAGLEVTLASVNKQLRAFKIDTLPRFPVLEWKDSTTVAFGMRDKMFLLNLGTRDISEIKVPAKFPDGAENITKSSIYYTAFTLKNNLLLRNDQSKDLIIASDSNKNVIFGQAVHRNEFGINSGIFWSPTSSKLAFYRMDQRMVNDYPVVNWQSNPAENNNIKYPMAGGVSHEVTVGIYNTENGKTVYLKTGEPKDQYLTNICWSPDEKSLFIAVVNREQNRMWMNQYDVESGEFKKTLFEEKDEKYVEPQTPMVFVPGNDKQFIWQSERDGYNHLYLYDVNGKQLKQLTSGNWVVLSFVSFDKNGKQLFYEANAEHSLGRGLFSVNLENGAISKITNGKGIHRARLNPSCDYVLDDYSDVTIPREQYLIDIKSAKSELLFSAENPLKEYLTTTLKTFNIKGKSGDALYCRMFLPANFDSTKKYPAIVYLYGGPHLQLVTNGWQAGTGDLWPQYMAQRGFVVFSMDNRGSANRGKAFEQATFRQLGNVEMEDQLRGLEHLKSLKYVDANRIGLSGWSFGGFLTTSMMTRNPGQYKAAVAGGPVIDWSMYEIMYTERYMDTPQTNPEGYKQNNLLNYAEFLKGKLLLIHGSDDDVVVWQHSLNFIKTCVDKGIPIDYFVYPGHKHNVLGKDRVHLMNKISEYFIQNL